jgi:beta-galactosidase/beta-glucuronidase
VDNFRTLGQFPLFEGWFGQGGFLREAHLVATAPVYLEHIGITAEPAGDGGRLQLTAAISNRSDRRATAAVEARIHDQTGKELTRFTSGRRRLTPAAEGELTVQEEVAYVRPWSPKDPALYTAEVTLLNDGMPVDALSTRFGFRKVEVKDAKILLNGEPVFLMGFNRHEDSPRTGMAVDLEQARADFEDMRRIGCNYVRLCHYPHHPGELDLCDELGLLVMTENGMNQWGSADFQDHPHPAVVPAPEDAPIILENGMRAIRKMVRRDRNHPSVILCSVSNETAERRADIMNGNSELIEYGRQLDPTRLWMHVSRDYKEDHYGPEYYRSDDVIVINTYPTHHVEINDENIKAGFPTSTQWIREQVQKLHRDFPDRPILVGEFGLPIDMGEEAQCAAVEAEFAALTEPYVAGGGLWHYAQHRWPGEDHPMSPYGYMSRDRKTRYKAMSVIERMFKAKAAALR